MLSKPPLYDQEIQARQPLAARGTLLAWRRIWPPASACLADTVCARPQVKRAYRLLFGVVTALVLVALSFPFVAPLFY